MKSIYIKSFFHILSVSGHKYEYASLPGLSLLLTNAPCKLHPGYFSHFDIKEIYIEKICARKKILTSLKATDICIFTLLLYQICQLAININIIIA